MPKERRTLGHADAAIRQARQDIDFLAVLPAQAAQAVLERYLQAWKNCWEGHADSEFCGVTFSPDGKTLYDNIQKPGILLAIADPGSGRSAAD